MNDYHNLHLKDSFLLLPCVFKTFRKESINSFDLNPDHYFSIPGWIWDAMLRFTNVNLKLISETEKYELVQSTISSGVSMICKGYAEASNKSLKPFCANKPTSYFI